MGTDRFRSAILHLSTQNRSVFFDESNEKNGNSHRNCENYRSNQQKIEKIHSSNQCKWRLFMLNINWEPFMFVWESFMTNWESFITAFHVQIQLAPHNVSLAKKIYQSFLLMIELFFYKFLLILRNVHAFLTASVTATAKAITTTHSKFRLHEKKQIYYSYL